MIDDKVGYLPIVAGGGNLFFQLANARYERGAMILASNRSFAEWGDLFGDPVAATTLLDWLLHYAAVVQIEGSSYRLHQYAELMSEHVRSKVLIAPAHLGAHSKAMRQAPEKWPLLRVVHPGIIREYFGIGTFLNCRRACWKIQRALMMNARVFRSAISRRFDK